VIIRGDYGTAVLTEHEDSIVAVLERRGGRESGMIHRFANEWDARFHSVEQMASAAAHGPGADLCTGGSANLCPHVQLQCKQIIARELGLRGGPGPTGQPARRYQPDDGPRRSAGSAEPSAPAQVALPARPGKPEAARPDTEAEPG
jgi:hypothetical protein